MPEFLPISKKDMDARGWTQCDFVYIIGDAYVDHPSFGHAIISRVLEDTGYKVGILSQPDWRDPASVTALGEPRLGFLVSGGNMDSMVNHYSVSKKRRQTDAFTPGGVMGKRPDYAVTVYCNLIRRTYKKTPIIIGGIEASLRRLAHYDYWSDKLKRSILLDAQADLLLYGMGERSIVEVADALNDGMDIHDVTYIDGTVFRVREPDPNLPCLRLPDYASLATDPRKYAESFYLQYCNTDPFSARRLLEPYGEHEFVVQNPPQKPLSQEEMDRVYGLPYCRTYHPSYEKQGGVPAISEVRFSLASNRGCFGACSFCALTFHQGRIIQTRSHESLLAEAEAMTHEKDFKGYIHDVGGPTANFRQPACKKQLTKGACPNRQCLFPTPCKNMIADHSDYVALLRKLRKLPGVKKVFIRSGIRFSYGCSRIFPGVAPYICYDILYGTLSIHMVLFCQFCRHDQHIHRICLTAVIGCSSTPPMIQLPVQLRSRCGQYILIQRTWFVCIQFCKLCFTGCCLYVMPIQGLPCMCLSCIFVILICGSTDIFDLRIRGSSFPYQPRGSIEIIRLITGASCRSRCLEISVFQLVVVADLKCRRFRQKLTGSILSLNLIVTAGTFIQRHIQCGSIFRYIIGISGYFMALHPCPGIAPFRMFVPFQCDTIRYITGQLCCQCAGILDVIRNCDRNSTCSILCIFFFI